MTTPIDRLMGAVVFHCTICDAEMGKCDCWERCTCGWMNPKGEACRNPATRSCSSRVLYGKYNRKTKRYE